LVAEKVSKNLKVGKLELSQKMIIFLACVKKSFYLADFLLSPGSKKSFQSKRANNYPKIH
jgi:hypothetical protein